MDSYVRCWSAAQRRGDYRREPVRAAGNRSQPVHQALEDAFLLVVVAVADADPPGMAPDPGRQKVHCGGSRSTWRIPVSIGSRSRKRRWYSREKPM